MGNAGRILALQHTLSLGLYERLAARMIGKDHFQDRPSPPSAGNLFEPMPEWTGVSGGWRADSGNTVRRMAVAGATAAVPAVLGWRLLRKKAVPEKGFFAAMAARMVR